MSSQRRPKVTLRVKDRGAGPIIYARFRFDGMNAEPALGRAWLVPVGSDLAKNSGQAHGSWVERRGRAPEGYLTLDAAWQVVPGIIDSYITRAEDRKRERLEGVRVTLAAGVERWLADRQVDDPHGERQAWKHSHAKNMTAYGRRFARELGPDRYIDTFTERELKTWLADELKPMRNGKVLDRPTHRKTRSTYAQALRLFFAYAVERGWIDDDPAVGLPAYRARRKRSDDPLRREEYLTTEELRLLLARLREPAELREPGGRTPVDPEQDAAMIMVMAMAGLRPGEAIALQWHAVDFDAKGIRVVESRTMGVTGQPKSWSGRTVPMADELATALRALRGRGVLVRPNDRVFVGRDGGHVDLGELRARFKAGQAAASIDPPRQLRQMRHTFGTVCAAGGVPLRTIQQWMGHASITTTEIYASFMPREQDAAVIEQAFR